MNEEIIELQENINRIIEFHARLKLFLLDLKGLKSPDVDRLFRKHQVEISQK